MKIEKGNILIAEFMGKKVEFPNFIESFKIQYLLSNPEGNKVHYRTFELNFYQESWDWLMPVVAKVRELLQDNSVYEIHKGNWEQICIALETVEIKAVWLSIVLFIQDYNKTAPKSILIGQG